MEAKFERHGAGVDPLMTLRLTGAGDIFRFAVNMLGHQVEFGRAGRAMLVELREHMTPERFDSMALSLLGKDRYDRLSGHGSFQRDEFCASCEESFEPGDRFARIEDAKALCEECARGNVELIEVAA